MAAGEREAVVAHPFDRQAAMNMLGCNPVTVAAEGGAGPPAEAPCPLAEAAPSAEDEELALHSADLLHESLFAAPGPACTVVQAVFDGPAVGDVEVAVVPSVAAVV